MKDRKEDIIRRIEILKALDADLQEYKSISISKGYDATQRKIRQRSRKQLVMHFLNRAAAILVVPLMIASITLLYLYTNKDEQPVTFTEITVAPGTIMKTQLPDKSVVWLNSETTLRYPSEFTSAKRSVELRGEAFFDVKSDPEHPFEVSISDGIKIIAKGTSFNVNAYDGDPAYEAVLQTGSIEVISEQHRTVLFPGEIAYIDKKSNVLHKEKTVVEEATGWKDGLLIFRNTPLDEVFKRLSRRYNVDIIMHNEAEQDYKIRATFSSETITQILDVLKMAAPLTWSVQETQQNKDYTYTRQQIDVWIK